MNALARKLYENAGGVLTLLAGLGTTTVGVNGMLSATSVPLALFGGILCALGAVLIYAGLVNV